MGSQRRKRSRANRCDGILQGLTAELRVLPGLPTDRY